MEDKGPYVWAPLPPPPPFMQVILCAHFFNWSLGSVTSIVISARKFACVLSPIVSFSNGSMVRQHGVELYIFKSVYQTPQMQATNKAVPFIQKTPSSFSAKIVVILCALR